MFVFWELVGVASYLLIGFWYHKPSAVAASKKAFIITRFADAFFLMGIIITAIVVGGLDFAAIPGGMLSDEAIAPLRDVGLRDPRRRCRADHRHRSACSPVAGASRRCSRCTSGCRTRWKGPTPVSSIIHSATMVVAGVYLTARMFPLFAAADGTLLVVEVTGAFTALFAAVIACVQLDIKRILAFSTLSQLGYMMFALGVADPEHPLGYSASMFHVFTHAFFKCLLFLSAGLVIHAVHNNDAREMGGLRKKLQAHLGRDRSGGPGHRRLLSVAGRLLLQGRDPASARLGQRSCAQLRRSVSRSVASPPST